MCFLPLINLTGQYGELMTTTIGNNGQAIFFKMRDISNNDPSYYLLILALTAMCVLTQENVDELIAVIGSVTFL